MVVQSIYELTSEKKNADVVVGMLMSPLLCKGWGRAQTISHVWKALSSASADASLNYHLSLLILILATGANIL